MNDFKATTDRRGTTSAICNIQFLCTMLFREAIRELDVLANKVGSTTNGHIKLIKEGLLGYLFPLNATNQQQPAMRCAMRKTRDLLFKIFAAQLM